MKLEFANFFFFFFLLNILKCWYRPFCVQAYLQQICFSNLFFVNILEVVHGPPWIPS